jgi:hypothetical protein
MEKKLTQNTKHNVMTKVDRNIVFNEKRKFFSQKIGEKRRK